MGWGRSKNKVTGHRLQATDVDLRPVTCSLRPNENRPGKNRGGSSRGGELGGAAEVHDDEHRALDGHEGHRLGEVGDGPGRNRQHR